MLVALALWAGTTLLLVPEGAIALVVPLLALSIALAYVGTRRGLRWANVGAILVVAGTFLGMGVFLAPLGLVELYAFVGVAIFTTQVTRFRSMVGPFLETTDESGREALRSLYITFLQRLSFLMSLVVLVSLILFTVATASLFDLSTEITAFALALGIFLALLAMARLRS